jgi:hypothetical protein
MSRRVEVPAAVRARLAPWYGDELPARVRLVSGSLFGWLFGLAGQHAVTINRTVHWTRHAPALETAQGTALLGHELYHVVQQQMGWWRFLARYLWQWRPVHTRRGYEHPMERPAYERQAEVQRTIGQA